MAKTLPQGSATRLVGWSEVKKTLSSAGLATEPKAKSFFLVGRVRSNPDDFKGLDFGLTEPMYQPYVLAVKDANIIDAKAALDKAGFILHRDEDRLWISGIRKKDSDITTPLIDADEGILSWESPTWDIQDYWDMDYGYYPIPYGTADIGGMLLSQRDPNILWSAPYAEPGLSEKMNNLLPRPFKASIIFIAIVALVALGLYVTLK